MSRATVTEAVLHASEFSPLSCFLSQVLRYHFCQLTVLLEEGPVARFVILPNCKEDETILRETLGDRGCSPSAEKHMRLVLMMEGLEGPNTQDKA